MRIYERRTFAMIEVSIESVYYIVAIASILCGAAFKLGYELGKNAKK